MNVERGPYLTIVEDKAEAPNNRFEWRENIRRFFRSAEEKFGRGRCGGLQLLESVLICGVWFTLVGTGGILGLIGNSRAVFVVWRDPSEAENRKQYCSHTLWFPDMRDRRCGREGIGIDKSGFFPVNIAFLSTGSTIHCTTNIDL